MILTVLTVTGLKGALSGKATGIAVGVISAVLGFNIMENLTGNNWISIAVSAICLVIVTQIKTRPKVIEAETSRESILRQQTQKEIGDLFRELHAHASNRDVFYQAQIDRLVKLEHLLTITKHAMANENGALTHHKDLLEIILREHAIDFPEFAPKSISHLTNAEDRIRADIVGIELPEA